MANDIKTAEAIAKLDTNVVHILKTVDAMNINLASMNKQQIESRMEVKKLHERQDQEKLERLEQAERTLKEVKKVANRIDIAERGIVDINQKDKYRLGFLAGASMIGGGVVHFLMRIVT